MTFRELVPIKKSASDGHSPLLLAYCIPLSGGSRSSDKGWGGGGGGGHPDPEVRGEGGGAPNFFPGLRASVWSKNKRGRPPLEPSLPLQTRLNPAPRTALPCRVRMHEVTQ